jgi:hypothetical protein
MKEISVLLKIEPTALRADAVMFSLGGAMSPVLHVLTRTARAGDSWDECAQNYLAFPGADGVCRVVEACVALASDDPKRTSMRVGAPVAMFATGKPILLTVRFRAAHFELFVDGVLLDEDWPQCDMLCPSGDPHFTSATAQGEVIAAAISDDDIATRAGGAARVRQREIEILGPEQTRLQYWRPRGHNTWVGDTMCIEHAGRLRLFYLADRRHGRSKCGGGGHQVAHASSADLATWEHHPMPIRIVDETWLSVGTGTPVIHDGRLVLSYGLHTSRMVPVEQTCTPEQQRAFSQTGVFTPIQFFADGKFPMGATLATSDDGVHFTPSRMVTHMCQNPSIAHDERTGLYYLLAGYADEGQYVSRDLVHWQLIDRCLIPYTQYSPTQNTMECQCLFEWNGWYYLLAGRSGFWMSRSFLGPWWDRTSDTCRRMQEEYGKDCPRPKTPQHGTVHQPRWDVYDGLFVPMVASFSPNRRILAGWLMTPGADWGGHLVFRELVQLPDGTLGMTWPAEMIPTTTAPRRTPATLDVSGCSAPIAVPAHSRVTMRITPAAGRAPIAVQFLDHAGHGCELKFIRATKRVQWHSTGPGQSTPDLPVLEEILRATPGENIWRHSSPHLHFKGGDFAIQNVEGLDQPFTLDVIATHDPKSRSTIIDACINGQRTLITNRAGLVVTHIVIAGTARVEGLTVRALKDG